MSDVVECEEIPVEPALEAGGLDFNVWLSRIGRDRTTGWRWTKLGWISPINIGGRNFVTSQEISRFWARTASGEFRKEPAGVCAKN